MAKHAFISMDMDINMDIDVQTPEYYTVVSPYPSSLLQWDRFLDLFLPDHGSILVDGTRH